jgi:gas vesicle protein
MNRLVKGLLIGAGIGVVIVLIVLLLRGEEQRRFLQERFEQAATRVSQFAGNAKDTVEQTMEKVKHS